MENPFNSPTTIQDSEKFIGRDSYLRRLFSTLKNGQNASLVGPRRIGKTSLLNGLRDEVVQKNYQFDGTKFLFLYIDLQERLLKPRANFLSDMNLILRQQGRAYLAGLKREEEEDEEFILLLTRLHERGLHPVLLLDTFDLVTRYKRANADLFGFLRAQTSVRLVSYVTASVASLRKILPVDDKASPFFNIFQTIRVEAFSKQEARELLTVFSQRAGLPFTEAEVSWVLDMAGYHPYFLQQVGSVFFEEKLLRGTKGVRLAQVRKEAYQSLEDHFQDCWEQLQPEDQQRLMDEIEQMEWEDGRYPELSTGALFRDYLHSMEVSQSAGVEISVPEIESTSEINGSHFSAMLKNLKDTANLGQSELVHLLCITEEAEQEGANSPIAKGMIVFRVLKGIFETMQGQDERSDTDQSWLYYNILYYRYFGKAQMNHAAIARRLALSTRQYYRLHNRAIARLWQGLQELEARAENRLVRKES